ncbi:MAG TPA: hypothetical protein VK509_06900 [Polyangiales bacterium]|nr:hypothetical protein [Polyangiales bacterium]
MTGKRLGLFVCSLLAASTAMAEQVAAPTGASTAGGAGGAAVAVAGDPATDARREAARYAAIVQRVAGMTESQRVIERAGRHGLDVLNVLWEDTGRYLGSSVGPNISDVTIEVQLKGRTRTALMPVLRHPNFSDKTGDVQLDRIWLPVGNQRADGAIERVSLREFLADPMRFMSKPDAGTIRSGSLLAPRDSHALVSAQAAFLPTPQHGDATFWPVIFNYQSSRKHPAVLTLLVTRQGTSLTVVDNARDTVTSESWGQRLFFNHAGERAPLTAERMSTVQANGETTNGEAASSLGDDANVLMIVQVPLKLPPVRRRSALAPAASTALMDSLGSGAGEGKSAQRSSSSDMEMAVLGHGPVLGPYSELDGLGIERDPRFPVRVTVQFYQATATGTPTGAEIKQLAGQIRKVYADADYVGSLVLPTAADRARPTAWTSLTSASSAPPDAPMCSDFAGLVERNLCM